MAKERNQQMLIDYIQEFRVFNLPITSSEKRDDAFSVLPCNQNQYSGIEIMEWQMKMICYKAANCDAKLTKEFFEHTDYGDIFEFFTLNMASKING